LPDPPYGIGNEFESSCLIKFLGRLYQSQVTLIDQIRQAEPLILVLLGNRYYESQVRTGKLLQCSAVPLLDTLREFNLFLNSDQLLFPYLLPILVKGGAFPVGNGFCD